MIRAKTEKIRLFRLIFQYSISIMSYFLRVIFFVCVLPFSDMAFITTVGADPPVAFTIHSDFFDTGGALGA